MKKPWNFITGCQSLSTSDIEFELNDSFPFFSLHALLPYSVSPLSCSFFVSPPLLHGWSFTSPPLLQRFTSQQHQSSQRRTNPLSICTGETIPLFFVLYSSFPFLSFFVLSAQTRRHPSTGHGDTRHNPF